ncbi:hypothetical protein MDAP_001540 [Mitosporidium daphniae]|uniref:Uncharacterized protein n=1 Tax=Mitosporidium daphniae TaxID=1485682 RepID=A0A098VYC7_9MICR|nr:uncharacterized protein DI09_136p60 [Mitosporidium daphniae]KGG52781.1 hypothetical protein DI09_136p60 [Mitosporidium daphniae]|eukprot:XP_013239217.1 uncharacterized protein DI09_136p60 [Mitosporidium daphniae]
MADFNEILASHDGQDEFLHVLFSSNFASGFSSALEIHKCMYTLESEALLDLLVKLLHKRKVLAKTKRPYLRIIFCLLHRLASTVSFAFKFDANLLQASLLALLEIQTEDCLFFEILTQCITLIEKLCKHGCLLFGDIDCFLIEFCYKVLQRSPPIQRIFQVRSLLKVLLCENSVLKRDFLFGADVLARIKQSFEASSENLLLSMSKPFLFIADDDDEDDDGPVANVVLDLHLLILNMKTSQAFCEQIIRECYAAKNISPIPNVLLEALSHVDDSLLMSYLELFIGQINTIQGDLLSDLIVYLSFFEFINFDVTLVVDWISSGQVGLISLMLTFTKRFLLGLHSDVPSGHIDHLKSVLDLHSRISTCVYTITSANPEAIAFNIRPLLHKFDALKLWFKNKSC